MGGPAVRFLFCVAVVILKHSEARWVIWAGPLGSEEQEGTLCPRLRLLSPLSWGGVIALRKNSFPLPGGLSA